MADETEIAEPAEATSSAPPRAERPMKIFLGLLLFVLVLHLIIGDHPWTDGVQKRERLGEPIRPKDLWVSYGYWWSAFNAVIVTAALLTFRRWFDRLPAPVRPDLAAPRRPSKIALALAGLAVVVGMGMAIPRLGHSMWDDEQYNLRRSTWGGYKFKDGQYQRDRVKWRDTFWEYRKPNNHVFHTILSRLSLRIHRGITKPELQFVSEKALRIPALLAGAGSIAAIFWLCWRLGFPWAGVGAAWLMALHPWLAKYASEARGYSLTILLVTVTSVLLIRVLQEGTWRRWAAYGVAQFLLLWTFPAALHHAVVLNVVVAGFLWTRDRGTPELRSQLTRWLFVCIVGGLFFVQIMTPNLIQFSAYDDKIVGTGRVSGRWIANLASHFISGAPIRPGKGDDSGMFPALSLLSPALVWAFCLVAVSGILIGARRLWQRGGVHRWMLAVLLLPGPLTLLQSWIRADHPYTWYFIFMLPPLALLLAVGLMEWGESNRVRALGAGAMAAMLGLSLGVGLPSHRVQWERSLFPLRESAAVARPNRDPNAPENQRILTVSWDSGTPYYDPADVEISEMEELQRRMRQVRDEGVELYVNLGRIRMCRTRHPEMTALVEEGDDFELVAFLPGYSADRSRYVWRYAPRELTPEEVERRARKADRKRIKAEAEAAEAEAKRLRRAKRKSAKAAAVATDDAKEAERRARNADLRKDEAEAAVEKPREGKSDAGQEKPSEPTSPSESASPSEPTSE